MPSLENAESQMRKGVLEFCTLLIIAREKVYASDILRELKAANLIVVEGTLYPLLSRLKTESLLDYTWTESSQGPPRKYYTLTPKGRHTLKNMRDMWEGLTKSIHSLIKEYEKNN